MPDPDHEARISALEARMDEVAADAAAARHLAAAGDRDLADLGTEVAANGTAIAALDGKVTALDGKVTALDGKVTALDGKVTDLEVKVDANRSAINALGVQTAGRFEQVDERFDSLVNEMRTGFARMDAGFIQIRGALDQTAAGHERIVELIAGLMDRDE